jgi:hypothetical protein
VTDQQTNITAEDLRELKEDLLHIRSVSDAFRLSGLNDKPDAFAGKQKSVDDLWEILQAWDLYLTYNDPGDTLKVRAFIKSALFAISAAEHMYARWESLQAHLLQDFSDEGHKRLIEKHSINSRKRFTDLAREAREAVHIAHFLINHPGGDHVKSS